MAREQRVLAKIKHISRTIKINFSQVYYRISMSKQDKKGTGKNNPSRRDFIKHAAAGALGTALGGVVWPDIAGAQRDLSAAIECITFGSCSNQDEPQPLWDTIIGKDPDLFLFIGDNIYADTADMEVMRKKYEKLGAQPGYRQLLKTCPVVSTWDDHDYGENDAGVEYAKKEESKEIFLDFFDVSQDSPRRKRPGIYEAYIYGPLGRRVQVILLDTRYFKDTSGRKRNTMSKAEKEKKNLVGWYLPSDDPSATLLGKAQWSWLEEQLRKEADVRIIASSIQVIASEKGMESWGNYPQERDRLFELIAKTKANGVMFISGDVHFSEISMSDDGPYPLHDFTSSGMTHANKSWSKRINSYRIGEAYAGLNFGLIHIDWNQDDPVIRLQTITQNNKTAIQHIIKRNELCI